MKTIKFILAIVAVFAAVVSTSCKKEDPIVPLNAVMGGKWVYEENDSTDGSSSTLQEILTFTTETDCKREKIMKSFLQNEHEEWDLTYTFDGEWGTLTGVCFMYTTSMDFPFKYDSINQTLTVWTTKYINNPDTKFYVYHRKK